jgi:hypothetical protein
MGEVAKPGQAMHDRKINSQFDNFKSNATSDTRQRSASIYRRGTRAVNTFRAQLRRNIAYVVNLTQAKIFIVY